MIYPVKYLHSAMRGAPVLSGTAGSLLAVLDACLGTGFGLTTLPSLTVSGGVATATVDAGNSFDEGAIVLIDGATPGALNGEARVLTTTSTGFTFATSAPDGPATGTITAKYAPIHSWAKIYADTNVAVWQSQDPQANGHLLRVDDSGTTAARVRGYESMTDANTGTGPFPTDAQISGGGYWGKSMSAGSTAVKWRLFGDGRFILPLTCPGMSQNATYDNSHARGFGDLVGLAPGGDQWATVLSAFAGALPSNPQYGALSQGGVSNFGSGYGFAVAPRLFNGAGGSAAITPRPYCGSSTGKSGSDGMMGAFPGGIDGRLRLSPIYLMESDNGLPRADVPGVFYCPQSGIVNYIKPGGMIEGSGAYAGRRFVALGVVYNGFGYAADGIYFVDATGPWR